MKDRPKSGTTKKPGSGSIAKSKPNPPQTARQFMAVLKSKHSAEEAEKIKRFVKNEGGVKHKFIGVRMKTLFDTAKSFIALPLHEIETLLESPFYEARMGAVSIMDFQARSKKITPEYRKALFDLYLSSHRHINNWDLVDRSAPYVIGGYLADKPRDILYRLAKSKNVHERRTAIVSTYFFIRQGDIADTFKLAAILVGDIEDSIHKAVGSWIREAGKKDKLQLTGFLDQHAEVMPGVMLRYATEKLDKKEKEHYLKKRKMD